MSKNLSAAQKLTGSFWLTLNLLFLLLAALIATAFAPTNSAQAAQIARPVADFSKLAGTKAFSFPAAEAPYNEISLLSSNVWETYPGLCVAPDGTASFAVGGPNSGVTTGSDARGWKIEQLHPLRGTGVNCAYDDAGYMHTVWISSREETGYFNILYNRSDPDGSPGNTRNLAQQLYGTAAITLHNPYIAFSPQQKKLFLYYTVRSEPMWPVMFTESGNGGESWSTPVQVGAQAGYRPAEPFMLVDGDGNPHIFYGVFTQNGDNSSGQVVHRMRQSDGKWTAPRNLAEGRQRPILTKARVSPNGDIFVTWTDGPMDLARWSKETGQWLIYKNVSGNNRSSHPAVAVGFDENIRIFWFQPTSDVYGQIFSRTSYDGGASWQPARLLGDTRQLGIGRFYGIQAIGGREKNYVLLSADKIVSADGSGVPSLFLYWNGESAPPPLVKG